MEGGDEYFSSYVDEEVHRLMLMDTPRTTSYRDAVMKNAEFFKGKVVMDVGAGTGILSLFCWKAGARKVYAVEASNLAIVLKDIVKQNGAAQVIEVIHDKAEDLDLPEKVDIIISEWMGFYLLHESMLISVIKARDKHLSEDGVVLPSHVKISAAPYAVDADTQTGLDFWNSVYGFDMSAMKKVADIVPKPQIRNLDPKMLIGKTEMLAEFDLKWVLEDEVTSVTSNNFVSITKNSSLHGVAIWFSADFRPYHDDWKTDITLDTSPMAEPTHWKQTLIALPESIEVEQDEVVGWSLSIKCSQSNHRHYNLSLEMLDPETEEHPEVCNCQMAKCVLIQALLKQEENGLRCDDH